MQTTFISSPLPFWKGCELAGLLKSVPSFHLVLSWPEVAKQRGTCDSGHLSGQGLQQYT